MWLGWRPVVVERRKQIRKMFFTVKFSEESESAGWPLLMEMFRRKFLEKGLRILPFQVMARQGHTGWGNETTQPVGARQTQR